MAITKDRLRKTLDQLVKEAAEEGPEIDGGRNLAQCTIDHQIHEAWRDGLIDAYAADELNDEMNARIQAAFDTRFIGA
jgi:hypothetical protein